MSIWQANTHKNAIFHLGFPKVAPKIRTWVQVVYLEGGVKKQERGSGENEIRKEEKPIRAC